MILNNCEIAVQYFQIFPVISSALDVRDEWFHVTQLNLVFGSVCAAGGLNSGEGIRQADAALSEPSKQRKRCTAILFLARNQQKCGPIITLNKKWTGHRWLWIQRLRLTQLDFSVLSHSNTRHYPSAPSFGWPQAFAHCTSDYFNDI